MGMSEMGMNDLGYQPVRCLSVPKTLFEDQRYKGLSTTAKILYSLLLERLEYAAFNGWIDRKGNRYVIYPKSEMRRDLNSTRYQVDAALRELEDLGNLIFVVRENGKPNRFYINDAFGRFEDESERYACNKGEGCMYLKELAEVFHMFLDMLEIRGMKSWG